MTERVRLTLAFLAGLAWIALPSAALGAPASVAVMTPTEAPLPAGAGAPPTAESINAVACRSAGNCVAVGEYSFQVPSLQADTGVIETETSGTWRAQVVPLPRDAGADPKVRLSAVSCSSVGWCAAVGSFVDNSGTVQALVLTESAGRWTSVQGPLPHATGKNPEPSLGMVACPTNGSCAALGSYVDSTGFGAPLVLAEAAGVWKVVSLPVPRNAYQSGSIEPTAMSCPAARACTIVGSYVGESGGFADGTALVAWAEKAGKWRATPIPLPSDASFPQLLGLSCFSVSSCTAVGSYDVSGEPSLGLIVSSTGGVWRAAEPSPLSGVPDSANVTLEAVSCSSATSCGALGYYFTSGPEFGAIDLVDSGGNWSASNLTMPADFLASEQVSFTGFDCLAAGVCSGVGTYYGASHAAEGVLVTGSAGVWHTARALSPQGGSLAQLDGIACSGAEVCTAVGTYTWTSQAETEGLLLRQTGSGWRPIEAPFAQRNPDAALDAVVCSAARACTAVGTYFDGANTQLPMAMYENKVGWHTAAVRLPAAAVGLEQEAWLSGLACPKQGDCVAVGSGLDIAGHPAGFVLQESSGRWEASAVHVPANSSGSSLLSAISCPRENSCLGVGSYVTRSGTEGLLESKSSGGWRAVEAPLPSNASTNPDVVLQSVACVSSGCAVIGSYEDSTRNQDGLLLLQSDGKWYALKASPAGKGSIGSSTTLSSISCPAAGSCTAVGTFTPGGVYVSVGLLLKQAGRKWILSEAPKPSAPVGYESLDVIVCTARGCYASGSYDEPRRAAFSFFLAESSGKWKLTRAPGNTDASVRSLSCTSTGACAAVGYGEVWTESEGKWRSATARQPSNGSGEPARLVSVGCGSATVCTAVGGYSEPVTEIANALTEAFG